MSHDLPFMNRRAGNFQCFLLTFGKANLNRMKKGVDNYINKDNCSYNFHRTLKLTIELNLH